MNDDLSVAHAQIVRLSRLLDEARAEVERVLSERSRVSDHFEDENERLRAALAEIRQAASNFVEWCNSDEGLEAAEAFPILESHQVTFENRLTTPEESEISDKERERIRALPSNQPGQTFNAPPTPEESP